MSLDPELTGELQYGAEILNRLEKSSREIVDVGVTREDGGIIRVEVRPAEGALAILTIGDIVLIRSAGSYKFYCTFDRGVDGVRVTESEPHVTLSWNVCERPLSSGPIIEDRFCRGYYWTEQVQKEPKV